MHKKITTKFQEGAEHNTVIDGTPVTMHLPPRLSIWTSSVDIHGDEQHRDRWVDCAINEDQTKGIIEFMKDGDNDDLVLKSDLDIKFETEVCRYILGDLAGKHFKVTIPFTDDYTFPESEKTRGFAIFQDLIKGLAALRYATRKINDKGHLVAEEDDFYDAKIIYEGVQGHSDLKFTTPEKKFLQVLIDLGRNAYVEQVAKNMKVTGTRVRQIVNGRGNEEQKRNGLASKCPALTVDYDSITTRKPGYNGDDSSTTVKKIIFRLDENFKLMDDHAEIILIKDNAKSLSIDRLNLLKHRLNMDKTSTKLQDLEKIDTYLSDVTKSNVCV